MTIEDVLATELAVMVCPDGWTGTWDVEETVRKTYAIVKT